MDFCIRSQLRGHGGMVGVPGARVLHPFWTNPLRQVRGWAAGDVLCLDTLSHRGFRAMPNWAEIAVLCALAGHARAAAIAPAVEVAMLFPRFYANAGDFSRSPRARAASALLGTLPPMLQDVTRLESKLRRLRLSQLCMHFDWMNGTGRHVQEIQLTSAVKAAVFYLAASVSGGVAHSSHLIPQLPQLHLSASKVERVNM